MKKHHTALRLLTLSGAALMATSPALAQSDSYPYMGLSVGESRSRMDTQRIADQLSGTPFGASQVSTDLRDTAFKAFGGYQFNKYFGLEAGYFDLGHFNFKADGTSAGLLDARFQVQGLNFDAVGSLPMGDKWTGSARIGAQAARTNANFISSGSATPIDSSASKREVNVKMGVGLQYAVNRSFFVRTEFEHFRVNDAMGSHAGVNMLSIGLVFPFGRAEASAPRPMALAPVAAAPAMPVAAVAAAPTPAPAAPLKRRVRYSVESLFTFDEAAIRPEGQAALDSFVRELKGTTYALITVEGHTDRLGTTEYNQALSLRRAEKVKSYLVTSGGVSPDKINVVAVSESMPITQPADCPGTVANAQLKACLQPDRRVEIEVTGTR